MKRFPSPWPIAVASVCVAAAFGVPPSGRLGLSGRENVPEFHDWTTRHIIYRRVGPMAAMRAAARDPRAVMAWREAERKLVEASRFYGRFPRDLHYRPLPEPARRKLKRDWGIYLGINGTAPNQYPAKFTFDTTASPSCINDFVIFPINAPGTSTQPNIVAFNYLYSGTAGATGVCNRKASSSDTGVAAEVMWSYSVQGGVAPGSVETSPAISYDPVIQSNSGTKVAFVESVATGEITTATIAAGGASYLAGDTGTISGGTGTLATYTVSTVSSGAVTAFTISYVGAGYGVATNVATTATTGTGTGFEVNLTAVSAASSHFHVLAWGSGASAGQNSSNLQSVLSPATITPATPFSSTTPAAGSGTATELNFSSTTDTLSSPFVDYVNDLAYVGDDSGVLYRIRNVFCTSVNLNCSSNPVPSLDTTWGTSGALTVCSGQLTGPVLDSVTGNVFVGCSDGKLYMVTQGGTISSVVVGDGVASETYGGIVDPPVVDGADSFVYAVSGSGNGGANGILVQAKTDLSSSVTALVGVGNQCNIHAPTPNNAYFTSITSPGALMYVAGLGTTGTVDQPCTAASGGSSTVQLYGVTFGAGGTMTAGAPSSTLNGGGGAGFEWSPLLEFYNATTNTDWLFIAALQSAKNNLGSLDITSGFPTGFGTLVEEGVGASGMVVDNAANSTTYPQAASLYFNALQENAACTNNTNGAANGGCAVKLTQAGLQ